MNYPRWQGKIEIVLVLKRDNKGIPIQTFSVYMFFLALWLSFIGAESAPSKVETP
jgi:hypothetical protein